MVFHTLDGAELQIEAAQVGFVGCVSVDGRKATRVTLLCGIELIVAEDDDRVLSSVMSEYREDLSGDCVHAESTRPS